MRQQAPPVSAVGYVRHHIVVMQLKQLHARGDVPNACGAIDAARCQMLSIRAKGQGPYQARYRRQSSFSAVAQVKKTHAVTAAGREPSTVAAKGQ